MRTPKQSAKQRAEYKYYAGFSASFVVDMLERYGNDHSRVLDPWNGSGTTTSACAARGLQCVGIDINPATIPVAWARLADPSLVSKLCDLLLAANNQELFDIQVASSEDELLVAFFHDDSAAFLRSLRNYLIGASLTLSDGLNEHEMRALSGSAFVILSEVLRDSLQPRRGTNPSWFSRPKRPDQKVKLTHDGLKASLSKASTAMRLNSLQVPQHRSHKYKWPHIALGDSRRLGDVQKFDLVISSPPYCTRIDYAIATTPELLALGGLNQVGFADLRKKIIGTVVTERRSFGDFSVASKLIQQTLNSINSHHTKAAATYYSRYFSSYFSDLVTSLDQISQSVSQGHIILVVQNSYFKEIEIDLRGIVIDILQNKGIQLLNAWKHPSRPTIAGSNNRFRQYRDANVNAEDVLVFSAP